MAVLTRCLLVVVLCCWRCSSPGFIDPSELEVVARCFNTQANVDQGELTASERAKGGAQPSQNQQEANKPSLTDVA